MNKIARRNRHLKVFSKGTLVRVHALDFVRWVSTPARKALNNPVFNKVSKLAAAAKELSLSLLPTSPQKKLLTQAIFISTTALVVSAITPGATFTEASFSYSNEYIEAYVPGDVLVSDEEGYLVKMNPQTNESSRIGMTDYAVHTIGAGESLSVIAERYGVGVKTIMWENNLPNANSIRAGQKLLVPPVDGISYEVASGDTLEKIATKYKIDAEAIIAQNALESEGVVKGQELFLPGAEPIVPVSTIASGYRAPAVTRSAARTDVSASTASPSVGKIFIFPTVGNITQGYKAGHYALDIADRSKPPVWAAGSGTVVKASTGTWGGGYGNHVIIDHGNGIQTLYGHLDSVDVYEGQELNQGDVIGIMGNTGRVYGATGIHLHWEVIDNGVKQYPGNYY